MSVSTADEDETANRPFNPEEVSLRGRLFGLPFTPQESQLVIIGVPWDLTASYRRGTARAPQAILEASGQLDLYHPLLGTPWQDGIAWDSALVERLAEINKRYSAPAQTYFEQLETRGNASPHIARQLDEQNRWMLDQVRERVQHWLRQGKQVGLVGGEHTITIGAIEALEQPVAVIHLDAHADLRPSYAGLKWNHASTMYHVLQMAHVQKIVSIGLRSFSPQEYQRIQQDERIVAYLAVNLHQQLFQGTTWQQLVEQLLAQLDSHTDIYLTLDIDVLDPPLCPGTGTPVPGGLAYAQIVYLLQRIVGAGKRLVGFDLVETGTTYPVEIDIATNLLFELACWTLASHKNKSA